MLSILCNGKPLDCNYWNIWLEVAMKYKVIVNQKKHLKKCSNALSAEAFNTTNLTKKFLQVEVKEKIELYSEEETLFCLFKRKPPNRKFYCTKSEVCGVGGCKKFQSEVLHQEEKRETVKDRNENTKNISDPKPVTIVPQ